MTNAAAAEPQNAAAAEPQNAAAAEPCTAVADLHTVLSALADPVRLEMTRRLFNAGGPVTCGALYDTVTKATASHHFKILREAGVVGREPVGPRARYMLRRHDVDAAYPGLLAAVVAAANGAD